MTVGDKIKKSRQLLGLTQVQLADKVALPVARIKQYESNIRNPKPVQVEEFAKALDVSIEYLKDHNIDSYNDVKQALFELEDTFGMKITEINGNYAIQFDDMELSDFLKQWFLAKQGSNSSSQTIKEYEKWKTQKYSHYLDEGSRMKRRS